MSDRRARDFLGQAGTLAAGRGAWEGDVVSTGKTRHRASLLQGPGWCPSVRNACLAAPPFPRVSVSPSEVSPDGLLKARPGKGAFRHRRRCVFPRYSRAYLRSSVHPVLPCASFPVPSNRHPCITERRLRHTLTRLSSCRLFAGPGIGAIRVRPGLCRSAPDGSVCSAVSGRDLSGFRVCFEGSGASPEQVVKGLAPPCINVGTAHKRQPLVEGGNGRDSEHSQDAEDGRALLTGRNEPIYVVVGLAGAGIDHREDDPVDGQGSPIRQDALDAAVTRRRRHPEPGAVDGIPLLDLPGYTRAGEDGRLAAFERAVMVDVPVGDQHGRNGFSRLVDACLDGRRVLFGKTAGSITTTCFGVSMTKVLTNAASGMNPA